MHPVNPYNITMPLNRIGLIFLHFYWFKIWGSFFPFH